MRQMVTYPQKTVERGDRAAGDDVELTAYPLRFRAFDMSMESKRFDGLFEEVSAQAPRLDEGDRAFDQARDDDSGQAGARSDVHPRRAGFPLESRELR